LETAPGSGTVDPDKTGGLAARPEGYLVANGDGSESGVVPEDDGRKYRRVWFHDSTSSKGYRPTA
jgi:hypothetical protein